jgi:nucleotide-binding universal stress UspA family protein
MKATKALDPRSRVQFENILFATDFSPASAAALPYAAEMAKRYGAKLYALHVRMPVVNAETPPAGWPALEKASQEEERERRETLRSAVPGIEPTVLIEEGDVWPHIQAAIEKREVDLLVVGTRGRSGLGKLLLGSKAEEILREAECPVLTVGPHSPGEPKRGGQFSEILYATDFGPESVTAAPYAISLAQEFQAHLTLLHVIENPKTGELVVPADLIPLTEQRLRGLVPKESEIWCEPRYVVEQGVAAEKILDVAKKRGADLIVLGVHRTRGFPGAATHLPIATAHKIVSQATCPVLTVRG